MIVTVTLNPAIDRTFAVDHLAFEDRAYIQSTSEAAGGRGLNSSRVIHSFGGETLALTIAGGETGERLRGFLRREGFPSRTVSVRSEIRTNFTITDARGLTANLNERGPELAKQEVSRFRQAAVRALERSHWMLLCGSLPPGVPASFYAELIALARRKKVRTILHASGEALREGIAAAPTLVTPNQKEAERLLDRPLLTRAQCIDAASEIAALGPESVVLSLGSRGAVAAFPEGVYQATPPLVEAVCPIGSGDALTAAYAWRISRRKRDHADALRWGVAAGTASALLPGMNFASFEQTEEMYRRVEVAQVG